MMWGIRGDQITKLGTSLSQLIPNTFHGTASRAEMCGMCGTEPGGGQKRSSETLRTTSPAVDGATCLLRLRKGWAARSHADIPLCKMAA